MANDNSIKRNSTSLSDENDGSIIRRILTAILSDLNALRLNQVFTGKTAGLAIKVALSTLAKAGNAFYAVVNGVMVTKAAATDMAALVGTTNLNKFNVYCFYIDASGNLTSAMGTQGATLAGVVFPVQAAGTVMIGFVLVNPTAADFIGGTTALDAAGVNAVYVDTCGPAVYGASGGPMSLIS